MRKLFFVVFVVSFCCLNCCTETANDTGALHTHVSAVSCNGCRQHNYYALLHHCSIHRSTRICLLPAHHSLVIQVGVAAVHLHCCSCNARFLLALGHLSPTCHALCFRFGRFALASVCYRNFLTYLLTFFLVL